VAGARPEATAGSSICAVPLGKPPPPHRLPLGQVALFLTSPPFLLQHHQLQQEPALGTGYQFRLRPRGRFTPLRQLAPNREQFYVIPLFQEDYPVNNWQIAISR